jgi:hypothetical protein
MNAPVAQLDRASVFGTEGWGFESLRVYWVYADSAVRWQRTLAEKYLPPVSPREVLPMAHSPKPFFRSARNAWSVQLCPNQTKLCDSPKSGATEKAVWAVFHDLMAAHATANTSAFSANAPTPESPQSGLTVGGLFEKYLDWCHRHRGKRTYDRYVWHLQRFCDHLTTARTLPALRPFHVVEWLDAHPG